MPEAQRQVQLGKQGVTENFIESLKNHFKKTKIVRISVLKGAGRDKNKVKEDAEKIIDSLGKNYVAKIIGFTIVVMKFRKDVR
jgi:RNA-binding protein YhbY